MKVIKVKAKVCHISEEQMEAQETYDLGNIAQSKEWVWKNIGMQVPDIYRIIEYDNKMSVILTVDEEKILVKEKFDDLFSRWAELKKEEVVCDDPDEEEEEDEEKTEDDLTLGGDDDDEDEN